MATYACLFHNLRSGGFYVKAFSASARDIARKRSKEWVNSGNRSKEWDPLGCSTVPEFIRATRKRIEGSSGLMSVYGFQDHPVSEKDADTLFLWYDYKAWTRDVKKPPKGVKAALERACKAILKATEKGDPIHIF